jgi:hypothetical protein
VIVAEDRCREGWRVVQRYGVYGELSAFHSAKALCGTIERAMKILLSPNSRRPSELGDLYRDAFQEAEDLVIASAYLTDWNTSHRLGASCKRLLFLVGTDFGLTRKTALRAVLQWIPKGLRSTFKAVPPLIEGGFHPKVVAWRARSGGHYCIIGSSNLSRGGFSSNDEVNVTSAITRGDFNRICKWLDDTAELSSPVTPDWIDHHYHEAPTRLGRTGAVAMVHVKLRLPYGKACEEEVRGRRRQKTAFKEISQKIRADVERCSRGNISDSEFWSRFWRLWGRHQARFQGSGLQFTGKGAKWQEACRALFRILKAAPSISKVELDHLVSHEIDDLKSMGNPARGAWLSEMLCHYFPDRYPIKNQPVVSWLAENNYRGTRGATEGQKYTELSQQLRYAVHQRPAGARDLAELDAAIWRWVHDRGF